MTAAADGGPLERAVAERLVTAFAPTHLALVNESHRHKVPPGSETHFKVVVVSELFAGQPLLARHRAVHRAVERERASGIHALTITAVTPAEWRERGGCVVASPPCHGGG